MSPGPEGGEPVWASVRARRDRLPSSSGDDGGLNAGRPLLPSVPPLSIIAELVIVRAEGGAGPDARRRARLARFERATCGFEVRRSIQLSYRRAAIILTQSLLPGLARFLDATKIE